MNINPTRGRRLLVLTLPLALLLAAGPFLVAARPARAGATFTVDSAGDAADPDIGDGVCDVGALVPQCTLRAAIEEANAAPGRGRTIAFAIAGADAVRTIRPASPLPPVTRPTVIDGYTQPGSRPNTLTVGTNAKLRIELDGTNAGGANGLVVQGRGSVVRGLAINRFDGVAIIIEGATTAGVRVAGNFVGISASGIIPRPNNSGVRVEDGAASTAIGGTAPALRNLVSGNYVDGISFGEAGGGNVVQGNLIGTNRSGTFGNSRLGNGRFGVFINDTSNVTVGGDVASSSNTIAYNGEDGVNVFISGSTGNRVLRNSLYANGGIGIDLDGAEFDGDGPTPNDPGDGDTGPNNYQNFPVIDAATTTGGRTTIEGRLTSTPNRLFTLHFFSNPSGNEAKTYLGQRVVFTGSGTVPFAYASAQAVPVGHTVTATATSGSDGTSELSPAREVT